MDAFWIILTGSLVATSCGLLGCFLLLRKMTMVGDAISHAVLPGIVIAYLFTGSRASFPMLVGAAIFGVITTLLIEFLSKLGKLQEDAAIGVSFTWLFSIGVILISLFAGQVDLDQECVLYGEIAYVPLETIILDSGIDLGPEAVWMLGGNFLLVLFVIYIGYKGLVVTSFDHILASSLGISTVFWHYLLMGMISLTTVFSFESVGAIMVVAFLIGPPAVAYLLTDHLPTMLLLAVLVGILSATSGYFLAVAINGSIAGAMATVIGFSFIIAFLFSPKHGIILKGNASFK
ncbi:MAG: metal ABC transporter permease [Bacteroidota bacterium]